MGFPIIYLSVANLTKKKGYIEYKSLQLCIKDEEFTIM